MEQCYYSDRITKATEIIERRYNTPKAGRQAFSSQTTILRNIISLVKLLKGKNPELSWFALPVCSSFQVLSKAKPKSRFQFCVGRYGRVVSKPQRSRRESFAETLAPKPPVSQLKYRQQRRQLTRSYLNTKVSLHGEVASL